MNVKNTDFSFFIGDTVWYAWKGDLAQKGYYEEQKIQKIMINQDTITYITNRNRSFTANDIGTLFFHSYEEANNIINQTSEIRAAA